MSDKPKPRRPRVFRDGEIVPAGVCVLYESGEVGYLDDTGECQCYGEFDDRDSGELCEECSYDNRNVNLGPLVEVILPEYAAAVAADDAVRNTA